MISNVSTPLVGVVDTDEVAAILGRSFLACLRRASRPSCATRWACVSPTIRVSTAGSDYLAYNGSIGLYEVLVGLNARAAQ